MRTALFASLMLLIFGGSPVAFRGCGDDPPPDVVLPPPRPDAGICVTDADCMGTSACADVRCLAGACVLVSGDMDRDHDGQAAPPCGTDCDDGDRFVHPGAEELCNGHDDDCNGIVDDGAAPTVTNRVVADLDGYASIAPLGDTFIVAVGNDARTLDRYGRVGPLFDVLGDRAVTRTETATAPDGRVLVASILEGGALSYAVITPGTPPAVSTVQEIPVVGGAYDVALAAHLGSFAMAWTHRDTSGPILLTVLSDTADPLARRLDFATDSDRASLASSGASLVLQETAASIAFVSPSLEIVGSGSVGGSLLRHGLASGDGFVVALTVSPESRSMAQATRFESATVGGVPVPVLVTPEGFTASDETRLALANGEYIATRAGFGDLHVTALDAALTRTTLDVALPRSGQTPVSIASLPGVVAVLAARPNSVLSPGTDLVLITACTAP